MKKWSIKKRLIVYIVSIIVIFFWISLLKNWEKEHMIDEINKAISTIWHVNYLKFSDSSRDTDWYFYMIVETTWGEKITIEINNFNYLFTDYNWKNIVEMKLNKEKKSSFYYLKK